LIAASGARVLHHRELIVALSPRLARRRGRSQRLNFITSRGLRRYRELLHRYRLH
jgi:hypothetical protein